MMNNNNDDDNYNNDDNKHKTTSKSNSALILEFSREEIGQYKHSSDLSSYKLYPLCDI